MDVDFDPIVIAKIDTYSIGIPFSHGAKDAGFRGQDWSRIFMVLLRIETSDGLVGWGDAFGYSCWHAVKSVIDNCIVPIVQGRTVSDIPDFMNELKQTLHTFGQNGVMQYALSGLDIALWDIKAKARGLPLRDLVGNGRKSDVEGYASLFKYGDPEVVIDQCRDSLESGFRSIKLHEITYENIKAARDACGHDVPLMVDVNCPWTPVEALEIAKTIRPLDIHWLEEPIYPPDNYQALSNLQRESGLALSAGENACGVDEFRRMAECKAVQYAQPSVTKVGGVSTFLEIRELCRTHSIEFRPHSPYFGPGFLASVQIIAAQSEEIPVEWFKLDLEASLFGDLLIPDRGWFRVGLEAGLGCDPDPNVVREYAIKLD